MEFKSFILALSSSTLAYLGVADLDHPEIKALTPNKDLAKHNIEILLMLREKTQGNLDPEESQLLSSIIADLQSRYVEVFHTKSPS